MQQVIWEADPECHRLEKFINYLRIEAVDGKELVFGELYETGAVKGMMWLEPEVPLPNAPVPPLPVRPPVPLVCVWLLAMHRVGQVSLCSQVLLLPLGTPPTPRWRGQCYTEVFPKTWTRQGLYSGWQGGL